MSGLTFYRSYDKNGHAFYSAAIKGTGRQIAIAQESAHEYVLELDGIEIFSYRTLALAKRAANSTAERVAADHRAQLLATGTEPPELF